MYLTGLVRPLRPIILVLQNPDHPRALAAGVLLHLNENREELGELRPRFVLALEREDRPVGSSHIGPDSMTVLDFDLEHGFASSTNSVTPLGQCDEVDLLLSSLTAEKAGPARSPC